MIEVLIHSLTIVLTEQKSGNQEQASEVSQKKMPEWFRHASLLGLQSLCISSGQNFAPTLRKKDRPSPGRAPGPGYPPALRVK
jgi:hypothetical protein